LVETYSKEATKEFVLQRLRLTPNTLGENRTDVPSVNRAIGGLQYGGHLIELFNRFESFKKEWFDHFYGNYALIEGHVLRGALRIINADEYPCYFKATRSVARRRTTYQKCPSQLAEGHLEALEFMKEHGPLTSAEFAKHFHTRFNQSKTGMKKLLRELYNYGKIARMGRKKQKPLYHAIEKLPYKLNMSMIDEKEAKEWLFSKCLSIYGPLTMKDIAHWVGWNMPETEEAMRALLGDGKIVKANVEGYHDAHFVRTEDTNMLNTLEDDLPENSFIRILFNDDALLLGYYRRLKKCFGYYWTYPQLSEGVVWRAAVLSGREIVGEAEVDMYARSPVFKIKKLLLRKELTTSEMVVRIEDEFRRHADFQDKTLEMKAPKLV
jgi:uncharacterized protein YcaQ